jgi:hypothetical protein
MKRVCQGWAKGGGQDLFNMAEEILTTPLGLNAAVDVRRRQTANADPGRPVSLQVQLAGPNGSSRATTF